MDQVEEPTVKPNKLITKNVIMYDERFRVVRHFISRLNNNANYLPDKDVLYDVRKLVDSGITQAKIAMDINISKTKLSQYMNQAPKIKGWIDTDNLLREYVKKYNMTSNDDDLFDESTYFHPLHIDCDAQGVYVWGSSIDIFGPRCNSS
ncbi:hypothetical protein E24_00245 [Faustovirus]|nr:hypothetical protein PRJ_Fausto_00230 [Faustovirus]AMN83173.1 hypothetical protein E24_00245 [Faustovirus]AMN84152.1 hypothetical protein D5a_00243 [Faustovirus]AMN85142.1 hypothetical protein E23_00244 [Faustovirus]QBR99138.1 hypothetical protein [Faustovirus mariensis]